MKSTRHPTGFTLIEAIGAVVLLSVAVPPMLWAIREAHIQRVDPVLVSRARWLVSDKLEEILADRNSSTRGFDYVVNGNYPAEPGIAGSPGFSRSVSIVETDADLSGPGTGYKKVNVEVEWLDGRGLAQSLTVATVVTEY